MGLFVIYGKYDKISIMEKYHLNEGEVSPLARRESLRVRVVRRRRSQRNELFAIVAVFTIVLGTWLWYNFIYVRTPEYAMNAVVEALKMHDEEKFAQYVDVDRVLSVAYDELTDDMLRYDAALTDETRVKYQRFYDTIKPDMTAGVRETLLRRVATGEWSLPTDGMTKGRQLGIDFERFMERSQVRNTEVIGVGDVTMRSAAAFCVLRVRDRYTQAEFDVKLLLEPHSDGRYKIVRVINYLEYLDMIAPLQNKGIADYIADTRDITTAYNERLMRMQDRFMAAMGKHPRLIQGDRAKKVVALIENEIIPLFKERQQKLDEVDIPVGAQYLANLRHQSTDITISSWERYASGIKNGSFDDFNAAETLKKQEIEVDLRITDIIRHNTVSQALPEIP